MEVCDGPAAAEAERCGVVGGGGILGSVESAKPDALVQIGIADLGGPLPPRAAAHAAEAPAARPLGKALPTGRPLLVLHDGVVIAYHRCARLPQADLLVVVLVGVEQAGGVHHELSTFDRMGGCLGIGRVWGFSLAVGCGCLGRRKHLGLLRWPHPPRTHIGNKRN